MKFIPIFGNEKHIQAVALIEDIGRMEKNLKEKMRSARGIKRLTEEIESKKRRVEWLIQK